MSHEGELVENVDIPQEYTYEELIDTVHDLDKDQIEDMIKEKLSNIQNNWRIHIYFIDLLRTIHKFRQELISYYLDTFCQAIQESLLNLRSQIQKNATILIQELFLYQRVENKLTKHFLNIILPTIFLTSTSSKQFIKQQSIIVVNYLQDFPIDDVIIDILKNICDNKNFKISELSSQILINIFQKQQNKISESNQRIINILYLILKLNQGKRSAFVKNAFQLCQIMIQNMGLEKFQNAIEKNLQIDEQNKILSLNQQKEKIELPNLQNIITLKRETIQQNQLFQ